MDGRTNHAGILRSSMTALVEMLRTDPVMIENDVDVYYKLDHPSKRIENGTKRFTMIVEPAGFSQTTGAGVLDLQYFTWIILKCKPYRLGEDEEDCLTYLCEYLTDLLHKKMLGGMSTYVSRMLLLEKSCDIAANHRTVSVKLADDEIGALIWVWQSPKSIHQIEEEGVGEFESATTVKIESSAEGEE